MRFNPVLKKILLCTLIVVPVVLFWISVGIYGPNAPWWDEFDAILNYLAYPMPERLLHIGDFHSEHRFYIPRLVFEVFNLVPGRFPFKACMMFGDCILLGYVFFLGKLFKDRIGLAVFIPFVWLLLDIGNCENIILALTAIQSHCVLVFALASCVCFARREEPAMLVWSIVFAILATLDTGSGMGIWPTLMFITLISRNEKRRGRLLGFLLVLTGVISALYFHGFKQAPHAQGAGRPSLWQMLDFSLIFLGNLGPVEEFARLVGIVSACALVYIFIRFRKVENEPMFAYLLFLLSNLAAAAVFRSALPKAGIFYRTEILAISIFACEAYLVSVLLKGSRAELPFRRFLLCLIPVAIALNIVLLVFAHSLLVDRRKQIEHGYRVWPAVRHALVYPDPKRADDVMRRYTERVGWHGQGCEDE